MDAPFQAGRTVGLSLSIVCGIAAALAAEEVTPATPRFPHGVATIDVARVYKECQWFTAEMNALKNELGDFRQYLEGQQAYLEQLQSAIKEDSDPTTREPLQVEAATLKTDVTRETKQKKDELLESEKELYADLIEVIMEEVTHFADAHQLSLVVRHNESNLTRESRKAVLDYVNRDVLYHADSIDITDEIIVRVNKRLSHPGEGRGRHLVGRAVSERYEMSDGPNPYDAPIDVATLLAAQARGSPARDHDSRHISHHWRCRHDRVVVHLCRNLAADAFRLC